MLSASILFAVICVLFLLLVFLSLPPLKNCRLPAFRSETYHLRFHPRLDVLPILLITVFYSVAAFWNLGDRTAPQTFVPMDGKSATMRFSSPETAVRLAIYPGVGTGTYRIESSSDAEGWLPVGSFTQDHVAVLKWAYIPVNLDSSVRYLRLVCDSGNPWLGEFALLDSDSSPLPVLSSIEQLNDEQAVAAAASSYRNSTYFDEIYHVRTAWEHLNGIWPYEISHPPLGKELIALGIMLFGMTPFGWRFSGTVAGVLMLPVMYHMLRRLFGSRRVAIFGTVLLASGFMHYVQTRIATVDSFAVLFILLMYDQMYGWLSERRKLNLALCGVFFGVGVACKWTCLYAGAGLAVLWLVDWVIRIRRDGPAILSLFLKNALFCTLFFLLIPALIYYFSYLPYGRANGMLLFSGRYAEMVLENQKFMFQYHASIVAEHPYSSRWYQWIFNLRPILYYLEYLPGGKRVSIAAFVNPLICWGGFLCLPVLLYLLLRRRDPIAGFLLVAYFSGLLPWIFISRLTFEYHYFASAICLVMMLAYLFWILEKNTAYGKVLTLSFTVVSVLLFVFFFPVLNGLAVDNTLASRLLGWLPGWPI